MKCCVHEATLNLHMHLWIFSHMLIASVDGKQHLSEVVFSALVGFSLMTGIWFLGRIRTPRTHHHWLWCSRSRGNCLWSPACPVRLQHEVAFALLHSFCHFRCNENLTRVLNTTSLKCCLPSRDTIDRRDKIHACVWRCFIEIHQVSAKKKSLIPF